jgi:hypothetical protein
VPPPNVRLMVLSLIEREQFLAEPHIAALSVSAGPDRGPLTVPIWYQYTPGGEVWVLTSPGSRKARLIEQAGGFSLMLSRRNLPPDKVQSYLEFAKTQLGDEVAIYLQPKRWLSGARSLLRRRSEQCR